MPKITYPKNTPARFKATFRSLLSEMRSNLKLHKREKWDDATLAYNVATLCLWRIQARDKKTALVENLFNESDQAKRAGALEALKELYKFTNTCHGEVEISFEAMQMSKVDVIAHQKERVAANMGVSMLKDGMLTFEMIPNETTHATRLKAKLRVVPESTFERIVDKYKS